MVDDHGRCLRADLLSLAADAGIRRSKLIDVEPRKLVGTEAEPSTNLPGKRMSLQKHPLADKPQAVARSQNALRALHPSEASDRSRS